MSIEVLDPTYGDSTNEFAFAERLSTLEGATVGFISNGKQGTVRFFDALERELIAQYGVSKIVREVKSNYSAPADPEILDRAKEWNALVSGIGD
jgi:hypothetical protein